MILLKFYVIFYVSNFYSSHCKYAMPFQQKHSFAIVVDINWLYVTALPIFS